MNNLIEKTKSAYEYPLLVKQLFLAPLGNNPDEEIIYRDQLTITYRTWKERVWAELTAASILSTWIFSHRRTIAKLSFPLGNDRLRKNCRTSLLPEDSPPHSIQLAPFQI